MSIRNNAVATFVYFPLQPLQAVCTTEYAVFPEAAFEVIISIARMYEKKCTYLRVHRCNKSSESVNFIVSSGRFASDDGVEVISPNCTMHRDDEHDLPEFSSPLLNPKTQRRLAVFSVYANEMETYLFHIGGQCGPVSCKFLHCSIRVLFTPSFHG